MSDSPRDRWAYKPAGPVPLSPVLDWPPRPLAWLRWISRYWVALGSVTVSFGFAWLVFAALQLDTADVRTLEAGWVARLWLRNALLLTVVAGGLHLWFITLKGQGRQLKYDHRDQAQDSRAFTFRNQVHDNVFWSLASGVTAWTAWEALIVWAATNGYAPSFRLADNPVWFALWFVLIPLWSSFHFYWIHRLLHWPPIYKLAHSLHHRNINIGPWSGISMHPIETLMYFSSLAIHFVVPSHMTHVLFHAYVQGLSPAFSHAGFESVVVGERRPMRAGDFFHQLHHRHFNCNYGTAEMPWDRVFGSFHDGTERVTPSRRGDV
ncbi:MAG: sterol desaturase family protein [Pseudomonadota bacterium]